MINLIKIALFVLVNIGGYNVIHLMMWITQTLGIFPDLPSGQDVEDFKFLLFEGGFIIWALCALRRHPIEGD